MYCHIVRDKITGEEYLIPFCYSMIHFWHLDEYTDRQMIKKFCSCDRRGKNPSPKDEELLNDVEALQKEIEEKKKELQKMEHRLDQLQDLLITVEQLEMVK